MAVLAPAALQAQQTIFNVPSTDILDRGKVYAELDVSLKPTDSASINKFSSVLPRVVVGAGNRLEIGLNLIGNIQPGADPTTLVPAIKWKPYQGKARLGMRCCSIRECREWTAWKRFSRSRHAKQTHG